MALAGIQSISQLATGLGNIALVTPLLSPAYGPINILGQSLGPALMFDYEGENSVILQAESTDHVIETNSSITDHVAFKPEKITVHGFKGELSYLYPAVTPPTVQVGTVLQSIGAFGTAFSISAQNVIDSATASYQAINAAQNGAVAAWSTINGIQQLIGLAQLQTKQQELFAQLYGYMASQLQPPNYQVTLFSVQTPWAIFSPCHIEEVRAVQDEKTKTMTDFFITFKMLRFAQTTTIASPVSAGRSALAMAASQNNGVASLTQSGGVLDVFGFN